MAKTLKKNLQDAEKQEPAKPIPNLETEESQKLPEEPAPEQIIQEPAQPEETLGDVIEAEPQKRRPGRPSKTDPPVLRSGIIERINNLESWEGTRVYVMRWEPYSNRKVGGRQSVSVKRYEGPFDEQDMLEDPGLGSGTYELIVNRTNPTTRQRSVIDSGVIRLLNIKYPPRIPKGEWVDDERNKDWEWARNLCDKTEVPGAVPIVPGPDPLIEILRDQIKAQNDRMSELYREMRETAHKKDPNEQTVLTVLLQKVLEKPAPPPPPPPDPVRDMFMTYLMKQLEAKHEAAPPPIDPMTTLDKQLELQKKLDEMAGSRNNGGRSRKSGTQEMITDISAAVAPILQPIVQVIAMGIARQQAQQAQQPNPQQQQQQPPPTAPAIEPAAAQSQQAPQVAIDPKQPTIEAFADGILLHLKLDKTGDDLAAWYAEKYGQKELAEVQDQGNTAILQDLKEHQTLWRDLFPYFESGELPVMLLDFVTFDADSGDDVEEPETAAAPASVDAINQGWTAPAEVMR